ncbi:MAG: hypothetical protein ACI9OJ_005273, partial [Myxococcota bacterium]
MTYRGTRALRIGWITVCMSAALALGMAGCADDPETGTDDSPSGTLSLTTASQSAADVVGVLYQ